MAERQFVSVQGKDVADSLAGTIITVDLVIAETHECPKQAQASAVLFAERAKRGTGLELFHIENAILDVKRSAHIIPLKLRFPPCRFRLHTPQYGACRGI